MGYGQQFFQSYPTDQRFNCVSLRKFAPITAVTKNADTVQFVFPRLDAPNVYLIHQTVLRVQCIIEKANGSLPSADSRVGPVNLTLHSMWEKVSMSINDKEISKQSAFYGYKSYMLNKLTYNMEAKNSFLETSGWTNDTQGNYGPVDENAGFAGRCEAFRQDRSMSNACKSEGSVYIGRLYHDLVEANLPLPSDTKINFAFEKAKDKFVLMVATKKDGTADTEQYKLSLLNVSLYVPVGVLSTPMFNAILSRWPSEPMVYHYRPMCMTVHTISQNTSQFISPALFPDSENPIRLCCVVVPTRAKEGQYSSNPFEVFLLFILPFLLLYFYKIIFFTKIWQNLK